MRGRRERGEGKETKETTTDPDPDPDPDPILFERELHHIHAMNGIFIVSCREGR